MELLIALYTTPLPFSPELLGWWMLWFLRIGLPGMPVLCLAAHVLGVLDRRSHRQAVRRRLRNL